MVGRSSAPRCLLRQEIAGDCMIRCRLCVMPDTRPDTQFTDGVCSACIVYAKRKEIDWPAREKRLLEILDAAHGECIVASSGGKDSHWQTLKLLELGAHVTCVTATTCHLTDIGRKNLDNLARYATTIEVSSNKPTRAKLNRLGLTLVGDISWPEHTSIFTTPFRVASDVGCNLIFYGENPQEAYGGPTGSDAAFELTPRWRSEFGGFLGLRPSDMVGKEGITERNMQDYTLPPIHSLPTPTAYFLGQFYEWDSHRNARVAVDHGMLAPYGPPCGANLWTAENLDNAQTGLHDHMMFRKFGYGRGCAQISVDVRSGRYTRDEAMRWVEENDGVFPTNYAGVNVNEILNRIEVTATQLFEIMERFTNHELIDGTRNFRPILKEFSCSQPA